MRKILIIACVMTLVGILAGGTCIAGVPASISYQGKLTNASGVSVPDGNNSMRFKLFDAQTLGNLLWDSGTLSVSTTGGVFTVQLGTSPNPINSATLTTDSVWLETTVASSTLPRVQLFSAPFALRAADLFGTAQVTSFKLTTSPGAGKVLTSDGSGVGGWQTLPGLADGSVTNAKLAAAAVTDAKVSDVAWVKLTGVPAGLADGDNDTTYSPGPGLSLNGNTFSLSSDYTDSLYWKLGGNRRTIPGTDFIGTTDDQPLEFRVNNTRGFRLEPTLDTPNVIGGHSGNTVTAGASGATISGGGNSGLNNRVTDDYGVVGGGQGNRAGDDAGATSDRPFATVAGGWQNSAGSALSSIGGGHLNYTNGHAATVSGGALNGAVGDYSVVPGGYSNSATGSGSFAAGQRAKANHDGAFVWADSTAANFASTVANQFLIRASGGVGIGTTTPGCPLSFANTVGDKISLYGTSTASYGFGIQGYLLQIHTADTSEDVAFGYGSSAAMTETMRIKGNGNVGIGTADPSYKLHVNGSVAGVGAYLDLSDLRYKTNIETIPNSLDKVMKLRGINFDWKKSEYPELAFGDGRQVGFVAQEIAQVLPEVVSKDDKGIYSVAYGSVVPLLVEAMKEQQRTIDDLKARVAEIDELKARLAALEAKTEKN